MALQKVFIAIARIYIIGLGLLDVGFKQAKKLIRLIINYYTNSASILYKEMLDKKKTLIITDRLVIIQSFITINH